MTTPIRVLHVDTDPAFAELVADSLERESDPVTVETATSATGALDRIEAATFDCVVSDYDLTETDGVALLEAVREAHPELPFILFTAKGSEAVASEAIAAGVTDYLQKEGGTDQYAVLANRIENAVAARRSRRTLTERTRRLETLIDNLPGMVYRCLNERGWPVETAEGEVEAVAGYTAEALETGQVLWGEDVVHPDDTESVWESVQDALAAGDSFELSYRIVTAGGATEWVWERGRGVYEDGDLVALEGFVTESDTRASSFYRGMVEGTGVGVAAYGDDGRYEYANEAFVSMLGADRQDVLGSPVWAFNPTFDSDRFDDYWASLSPGETRTEEATLERDDGSRFPAETITTCERIDGVEYHFGTILDRSERAELEAKLTRQTNMFNALLEQAPVGIFFKNEAGEYVRVSQHYVDSLRDAWDETPDGEPITRETVLGRTDEALLPEEAARETVADDRQVIEDGETVTAVDHRPEPGEHGTWARTTKAPWRDEDGGLRGLIGVTADISDRKRSELELERQNERLDEFAGIVSHDLRNPLNVAQGRLELAREEFDSDDLDHVADALDRADALIDDLLAFARDGGSVDDGDPVDLAALAESSWRTVDTHDAQLVVETDLTVRADERRLTRLFENLFRNSVEHGSTSSRPEADDAVEHGRTDLTVTVGRIDGGFYVADDGPGIPVEEREAVFEGGYSAADAGAGTGLGLAIVAEIADAHGWDVAATEGEAGGARFEFTGVDPA
jgi:PAS domain S-box-containing protein